MKKKVLRLLTGALLLGWMAVIFLFSHQPAVTSSEISGGVSLGLVGKVDTLFHLGLPEETLEKMAQMLDYPVRKAAHMTEYAILALLAFAFLKAMEWGRRWYYRAAWLFAVCYAATDEFHQLFVAGRSGRASDVCIDGAGAALGLLALFLLQKIWRKRCEIKGYPIE